MHSICVLLINILIAAVGVRSECLWYEDRTAGVLCAWPHIDPVVARADLLQTAVSTQRLQILCDPLARIESTLPAVLFAELATVQELHVDGCKLLQLPADTLAALPQLHTLRVNTHNADLGQANRLLLAADALASASGVQALNLAANNMRTLPTGLLCGLHSLQHLNVSHNRLRSAAADLGLAGCADDALVQLRTVDLSANELLTLLEAEEGGAWSRRDLRSVQTVLLQGNNLTQLAGFFDGMPALRVLNASANQLETLPSGIFANNRQLQELHLQHNRLYQLPVDVFANLSELLVLDLSGNQLSSHYVDAAIFSHLQRLVVLQLSNNALTRLEAATFARLGFLQILDLHNNSIGFVDDQAFAPLVNLHTLNLAGNRLHIVNNDLFNGGLYILSRLVLSNNLITVVESAAFRNCTGLRELDLSGNQLSDVPVAIGAALQQLRSLDLGENRITSLRNDSFGVAMPQLTGLRLMDNLIANVTIGCLFGLPKLNVLNLARNKIGTIELGAFERNQELEAIRLDRNLLSDVNGIFATLNSLQWLNLSENQLSWFDYAFIPKDLRWLDVHGNYIEALGNYYQLKKQISLQTMDASHNRIVELSADAVPDSIELFFVNNNLVRSVAPNTFVDKINLTRVDLYANALAKVSQQALRIAPMRRHGELPDFYLGGNPLECDCSMSWLRRTGPNEVSPMGGGGSRNHHHQLPRVADFDIVECLVPHKRTSPVRLLSTLGHQDFLCRFEAQCPNQCSCFGDLSPATGAVGSGAVVRINCGQQNALSLPERLPVETTQLYLDGNNYLELKAYALSTLKRTKSLYLNGSNIVQLQEHSFAGLSGLHRLHLNDNKLATLNGFEFRPLYHLRELYLHDNMLRFLANETFASLRYLQVLRLDGNRLTQLTQLQMQSGQLRGLRQLWLAENPWSCACEFVQDFVPFVYDNDVEVVDAAALWCGELSGVEMEHGRRRQVQQQRIAANMTIVTCGSGINGLAAIGGSVVLAANALPEGIPHGYVPLLGFALTLVLVLAVLVAVFTVKERLCCVAYGNGGRRRMGNDGSFDAEKNTSTIRPMYDALVLSSHDDSDYVAIDLVAALRQAKPGLALGVQHRNVATDGQTIVQATARSHKIVVYLTNTFLQTEWRRPEVRRAISNSWIPGKIVLLQTPNVQFHSTTDRELIDNIGRGIVLLRTWEPDFVGQLSYALDMQPAHYVVGTMVGQMSTLQRVQHHQLQQHQQPQQQPQQTQQPMYVGNEKIWKSDSSRLVHHPAYQMPYGCVDYGDGEAGDMRNDSYYSSATAESVLAASPQMVTKANAGNGIVGGGVVGSTSTMATHVYAGIDSDYGGSVTNEDSMVSVHKPLVGGGRRNSSRNSNGTAGHVGQEPTSPVISTASTVTTSCGSDADVDGSAATEVTAMMTSVASAGEATPMHQPKQQQQQQQQSKPVDGFFV